MAQNPMMSSDGADDAESGAAADDESDDGSQPIATIEVEIYADGHIEVELESEDQEEGEGADSEANEPAGQTCQSIGEALKAVLGYYKQVTAEGGENADEQMSAGFNSVRGGA